MLGTTVNAAAIVVGSLLGLLLKGGLKEKYKTIINHGMGLAVLFVGISGCVGGMLKEDASPILYIISLSIGGVLGEWWRIEDRLVALGDWVQSKIKVKNGQGSISQGLVSASLIFCVGTMAVLGAIESGVNGNHSILFAKSLLDGTMSLIMAATLGLGVLFSSVTVFLYQGAFTLLGVWISPYLTADMMREISIVGGVLIAAIGLNMLKITKIKTGNMLPAMFVPIFYYLIANLFR